MLLTENKTESKGVVLVKAPNCQNYSINAVLRIWYNRGNKRPTKNFLLSVLFIHHQATYRLELLAISIILTLYGDQKANNTLAFTMFPVRNVL